MLRAPKTCIWWRVKDVLMLLEHFEDGWNTEQWKCRMGDKFFIGGAQSNSISEIDITRVKNVATEFKSDLNAKGR